MYLILWLHRMIIHNKKIHPKYRHLVHAVYVLIYIWFQMEKLLVSCCLSKVVCQVSSCTTSTYKTGIKQAFNHIKRSAGQKRVVVDRQNLKIKAVTPLRQIILYHCIHVSRFPSTLAFSKVSSQTENGIFTFNSYPSALSQRHVTGVYSMP